MRRPLALLGITASLVALCNAPGRKEQNPEGRSPHFAEERIHIRGRTLQALGTETTDSSPQDQVEETFWDVAAELEDQLRARSLNFTLVADENGYATLQRKKVDVLEIVSLPEHAVIDHSFRHHVVYCFFEWDELSQKWLKRETINVKADSAEQLATDIHNATIGY